MHLSNRKRNLNRALALVIVACIGLVFAVVVSPVRAANMPLYYIMLAIDAVACFSIYSIFTKKFRERDAMVAKPFPEKWRQILQDYVAYYRALDAKQKELFETEIQIFLHETRVTGIQTDVDDVTLVLAAASAEIPVFSFPEWEYENLGEILIYPNAFTKDFRTEGEGRSVWGMVGTGVMEGIMILAKPALIAGFQNHNDKSNVGIHEFAHLIDAADGQYDGIPHLFLENQYIAPWLEVMHYETERIRAGESKMNPYGATSKVEFFAVATEYFFEHPDAMQSNKPELYALMQRIFKQDTKSRFKSAIKSLLNYTGKKIDRNAPCPCQSGKKYKQCCLQNARLYEADPMDA